MREAAWEDEETAKEARDKAKTRALTEEEEETDIGYKYSISERRFVNTQAFLFI